MEDEIEDEIITYDEVFIIDDYSDTFKYDIIGTEDLGRNDFRRTKYYNTSYVIYNNEYGRTGESNITYYFEMYTYRDITNDEYILMGKI